MAEVKSLPDSPGWWLQEGAQGPVEFVQSDVFPRGIRTAAGRLHVAELTPGRWLKVELPTFPPREKAGVRLCWVGVWGARKLASWHVGHDFPFLVGGGNWFSAENLDGIVWITSEWLDEIQPHK